jgi:hypothetical protein
MIYEKGQFSISLLAQAPKPPIPVELFFGNGQLYFEMVVTKQFAPESRLGLFMVARYSTEYDDFSDVDITIPAHLYYNFWKGITNFWARRKPGSVRPL